MTHVEERQRNRYHFKVAFADGERSVDLYKSYHGTTEGCDWIYEADEELLSGLTSKKIVQY